MRPPGDWTLRDKIAESLEGEVTLEPDWLSDCVDVLPEDRVRIDPDLWARRVGFIERRETIRPPLCYDPTQGGLTRVF